MSSFMYWCSGWGGDVKLKPSLSVSRVKWNISHSICTMHTRISKKTDVLQMYTLSVSLENIHVKNT